jgi:Ca2+-binding EF-hand superfamily protein
MAFYGLNFKETSAKNQPMKPRGLDNRSFIPVKDEQRRVQFQDPHSQASVAPPSPFEAHRPSAPTSSGVGGGMTLPSLVGSRPASTGMQRVPPLSPAAFGSEIASRQSQTPLQQQQQRAQPRQVALVFQLPNSTAEREIFNRVDFNGNGMLSLAELDKAVVELWPKFDNKPAIIRAYKAADANGTGFISRGEFSLFLRFLVRFTEVWCIFTQMDANGDRKLSLKEFQAGAQFAGLNHSPAKLQSIFEAIDVNRGGAVLFDEFCQYIAEEEIKAAREELKLRTKAAKPKAPKKIEFLQLPSVKDVKKLFEQIDVNRNNILSLAELDKAVLELWPQFNNKPALMRAYKAADVSGNGFLSLKEFTAFLQFLVVYQNLWQQFEKMDENGDRRLSLMEFRRHAPSIAPYNTMKEAELDAVFQKLDTNGGGAVLFDEFCTYAAADVLKEFLKQQQSASATAASKAQKAPPSFVPQPCTMLCHVCGKHPAEFSTHVQRCVKDYNDKVKSFPHFLQREASILAIPPPRDALDLQRYNDAAHIVFTTCSTIACPECGKGFSVGQFLGHWKTHTITYTRKMELQRQAALQRPSVDRLALPQQKVIPEPEDVVLGVKLQCVAPFDLAKLGSLRKLLYVHRVRTDMIDVDELGQILKQAGVVLHKDQTRALLGHKDRGSVSSVMAAIDKVGCSPGRRQMLNDAFTAIDSEKCDSVEYRRLRTMLPSEGLLEMFARPLERHVSRREFEGILSDLSVLYRTDEEYRALFERPPSPGAGATSSNNVSAETTHRIRITHVSGEVKVVEIAAQAAMKLDKGSLTRRLGLLGIRDIQRLEVIS